MLRSLAILLLCGVVVFANSQSGWKNGKEYSYKVRSRTLASINQQSKQFSGILTKAYLTIQSNGQDTLRAKVSNARYSRVHTSLDNGWDSEVPNNKMTMEDMPLSNKPFEIRMKNGVIEELIVDEDVPTWEVNILKSIASQFQVDTQGRNAIKSKHNQLPESGQPLASFKTMEDSVGGKCEVLYDISPLSEQSLQSRPELAPMPELREDGEMLSLVKTKNFSHCSQRVSYHSGINGRNKFEPGDNDNGRYLSRSSVSRIVISGDLKKFTIQSSVTNNKVVLNPDQNENQQGIIASKMNVTLNKVKDVTEPLSAPNKPQSVGNLVYNYNNPFESSSSRRVNKINKSTNKNSDESTSNSDSSSSVQDNNDDNYLQPKPTLLEAPRNPMLPYFIGNKGNSIQKDRKVDAVRAAKNIAQEIGRDMQKFDIICKQQTLEKFTILTKLIRTMNAEQLDQVQEGLYEPAQTTNQLNQDNPDQKSRRSSWAVLRDAVANAGTGPALVQIQKWIQDKKIQNAEAGVIIDAMAKSAKTPTPEYMNAFFDLVKSQETNEQPLLRDAALLSFSDLVRHAIVNKKSAHNRYPVHAFGRLFSKNNRNLHSKFIPHFIKELEAAITNGNSKKIQSYTIALGRIGHPRILSVFEPYIEGRKVVSPYQRLLMVMSLENLVSTYPKVARSVLYKIYSNTADHHEIRCAAVFMLMKTNPPASMLQRMAESTNFDSSKHVNSAVKSSIESLAQLQNDEARDVSSAARSALPLLTTENFGIQYTKVMFKNLKTSETNSGFSLEAKLTGSDDSIIPKGVSITISPMSSGLKMPKIRMSGVVSSVRDVWNFVENKLGLSEKSRKLEASNQQKFAPENIARMLEIRGEDPQKIEGFIRINEKNLGDYFLPFDDNSLGVLPEKLNELDAVMKRGLKFEATKFNNYEATISFPTETGYPLTFTLEVPTVMGFDLKSDAPSTKYDAEKRSPIPKSAIVNGKLHLVYGLKVQKRIGFVTPFESQEYIAGVDQNMHAYLPLKTKIEYDTNEKEAHIKIQVDNQSKNNDEMNEIQILQAETNPFTSKYDILSLKPISNDRSTYTIHKHDISQSEYNIEDNNNKRRLQFKWESQSSYQGEPFMKALKFATSLAHLWENSDPENTEYEKYSIKVSPSNDMSLEARVSYDTLKTDDNNRHENYDASSTSKAPNLNKNLNKQERKQNLLKKVTRTLNSAQGTVIDASFKLNGEGVQSSAMFTAAVGKSEIDKKTRILAFGSTKLSSGQEYHAGLGVETKNLKVQSIDYEETLRANRANEYDLELHYGRGSSDEDNEGSDQRINVKGYSKQSEERKNEIRNSQDAKLCNRQKSENPMSPACQRANNDAAFPDSLDFDITFEKESFLQNIVNSALKSVRRVSDMIVQAQEEKNNPEDDNKIKVSFILSPTKKKADLVVKLKDAQVKLFDFDLNLIYGKYEEKNENIKDKQNSEWNPLERTRCTLDKSEIITLDNHRYPVQLGQCWYVAMTSYPRSDRPNQQKEIPENMRVSVLTRDNESGKKELKITIGDEEVELSSTGSGQPEVKVNGKSVKLSKEHSYKEKKSGDTVVELFKLSDNAVKLISDKYNMEVIYDGSRAQIKVGERYRKSVRGLCGNDDGESENDQQTPKGCQLRKSEEFAATWALITDEECKGPARENTRKAKDSQCVYESAQPGNYISDDEAGRENQRDSQDGDNKHEKHCMHHRTKVMKYDNEICFSIRPVPVCSSRCRAERTKERNIDMHCVPRTSAAERVAQRVESGANPDLSQKQVTKSVMQAIPITCMP